MHGRRKEEVVPQSKHRDIFEALKADILGRKREDSRPLPSAPALMRKFGVARGTVDRAMDALEREGFIVRRKGSGTYPVKREPIAFAVIMPDADKPFYTRVCTGIANCANLRGGANIRCYGRMRRLNVPPTSSRSHKCALPRRCRECFLKDSRRRSSASF